MSHLERKVLEETNGPNPSAREGSEPLLSTKFFIPPIRSKRVARPGLIGRMNQALDRALILISAPAGFGKTTLLAEWAAQAGLPVAWLSLGAEDNDTSRFLRYVIAALNTALSNDQAPICATSRAMLQSVQPLPLQATLVTFINELTDVSEPFALLLDDYQFVTDPAANQALTFILERLPAHAHLVIATRVDPALPLHRLRATDRLLELRTEDLRFSVEETNTFMDSVMGVRLSEEDVSILHAHAEGWIVGLQMAALSMQGMADCSAFIQSFSGSHRYVLEYLIEEVLNRQPENIQLFLLQTSVLDRLCGSLCDAVLGEECSSQAILEHLDRSNLFLTPLDQVGHWYRYHHLFADLLRARLQRSQPGRLQSLHLRASQWFEKAALPQEAIEHALAAGELERVARLVEQYGLDILSHGEMSSLLRLFDALPAALVLSRPALSVLHAWSLTFSGQLDKVEPELQEVEKQIGREESGPGAQDILGGIAIIRALIADIRGDMSSAIQLARRSDQLLAEENLAARSIIPFVLGDGYMATGQLDKAELAFEKIRKIGWASGNLWTIAVAHHKLALLKKLQGKLGAALHLYEEAIQLAGERGGRQYGSMGATYVGLSDLLRERNELEAARQMVTRAIENMEHWQSPTDLVNGYVTLARVSISEGKFETAEGALEKAGAINRRGNIFAMTQKTLDACRVQLWLATGEIGMANQWAEQKQLDKVGTSVDREIDYLCELEWITMARVLIARNELDRSLRLLSTLEKTAASYGRNGRLIEILVLSALVLHRQGRTAQALDVLTKSLELAEPEGYVRIFLDEGGPMEELLQACNRRTESSLKTYIDKLLKAFKVPSEGQTGSSTSPSHPERLVEPLTGREIEVLHLLAAGLSNRDIAERLYLSEGTVKTHTHNLYAKMGVRSRTQAIARAEELKVI